MVSEVKLIKKITRKNKDRLLFLGDRMSECAGTNYHT